MNWTEYKKYHESFMQGNHGSTACHTFCCVFFTVQCSLYCAIKEENHRPKGYFFEYFTIVVSLVLAHTTVLSEHIYALNLVLFSLLLHKIVKQTSSVHSVIETFENSNSFPTKYIYSISILRGLTYLITVLCILAVDFEAFPRYLAKTEQYGFSLMDTGVGLFVLMSGLVHKDVSNVRCKDIFKSNSKFITILLILGVTRYVSIKQLDYQEHVTEYGVHWNFFFTLAVCKLLSTLILSVLSHFLSKTIESKLYLSVTVVLIHEIFLVCGLQRWVFSDAPRTDLITANREGISSSLGYVALYLFAVYIKDLLCTKSLFRYEVLQRLLVLSVILWILLFFVNMINPTSRTLANAGYCIYLSTMLTTVMFFMYLCESICQDQEKMSFQVPYILKDVNQNGLLYFLLANLLTGAVNLSIQTLFVPKLITFFILNCYMIITVVFVVCLRIKNIKI